MRSVSVVCARCLRERENGRPEPRTVGGRKLSRRGIALGRYRRSLRPAPPRPPTGLAGLPRRAFRLAVARPPEVLRPFRTSVVVGSLCAAGTRRRSLEQSPDRSSATGKRNYFVDQQSRSVRKFLRYRVRDDFVRAHADSRVSFDVNYYCYYFLQFDRHEEPVRVVQRRRARGAGRKSRNEKNRYRRRRRGGRDRDSRGRSPARRFLAPRSAVLLLSPVSRSALRVPSNSSGVSGAAGRLLLLAARLSSLGDRYTPINRAVSAAASRRRYTCHRLCRCGASARPRRTFGATLALPSLLLLSRALAVLDAVPAPTAVGKEE